MPALLAVSRRPLAASVALGLLASTIALTGSLAASAAEEAPPAAQLLAQPFESTGVRVSVSNVGEMLGLATDGTVAYILRPDGSVVTTPLTEIPLTPGSVYSATGTVHTVGWGVDGAPTIPGDLERLSIAYSQGCLWITSNGNAEGSIGLTCIDVSDWSVTNVVVPADKPLPAGSYFTHSSLIDFPDGRIGKVSRYTLIDGGYRSVLRTYTVTGVGADATIAWSQDYTMFDDQIANPGQWDAGDPNGWARDEHGIATDGTYLYRIQWRSIDPNTKVWALQSEGDASVVWQGSYTMPFDNMHYLAHNHRDNYYLVGHYRNSSFFITAAADPGPGPGNPLTPAGAAPVATGDGCSITLTNYDAEFLWGASSTAGSVEIGGDGVLTLTGLERSGTATITVTTERAGYPGGSAEFSCEALAPTEPGVPEDVTAKSETGQLSVAWNPPADDGGSPITAYEVEVRDSAGDPIVGAECTTTTTLYCTVDELIDGTAYRVAVRTINAVGPGPWATEIAVTAGEVREESLPGGGDAADLTVDDSTPTEGQQIELTAQGFRPGSQVGFWLHSAPVFLGSAIADGGGTATLSVVLPVGVVGSHTVQALGVGPATGADRNLARGIVISAAPRGDGIASTGVDAAPLLNASLLLLVLGVTAVAVTRRRPAGAL